MTDTLWSDISEFQVPVNNTYPHKFLCFRSNDGEHLDANFARNIAWCRASLAHGRIFGFMVYYFFRPGVNGAEIVMSRVGTPPTRMAVMIDVESDGGNVAGNHSAQINAEHDHLARWLGTPHRVIGYGNVSDLNSLWPQKPAGMKLVVANYSFRPTYPGMFAHQFSDSQDTAPFGPSDINSADGMSQRDLEIQFGWASTVAQPVVAKPPAPTPAKPPVPAPAAPAAHKHVLSADKTVEQWAAERNTTVQHIWMMTARNMTANDLTAIGKLKLPGMIVYTSNA